MPVQADALSRSLRQPLLRRPRGDPSQGAGAAAAAPGPRAQIWVAAPASPMMPRRPPPVPPARMAPPLQEPLSGASATSASTQRLGALLSRCSSLQSLQEQVEQAATPVRTCSNACQALKELLEQQPTPARATAHAGPRMLPTPTGTELLERRPMAAPPSSPAPREKPEPEPRLQLLPGRGGGPAAHTPPQVPQGPAQGSPEPALAPARRAASTVALERALEELAREEARVRDLEQRFFTAAAGPLGRGRGGASSSMSSADGGAGAPFGASEDGGEASEAAEEDVGVAAPAGDASSAGTTCSGGGSWQRRQRWQYRHRLAAAGGIGAATSSSAGSTPPRPQPKWLRRDGPEVEADRTVGAGGAPEAAPWAAPLPPPPLPAVNKHWAARAEEPEEALGNQRRQRANEAVEEIKMRQCEEHNAALEYEEQVEEQEEECRPAEEEEAEEEEDDEEDPGGERLAEERQQQQQEEEEEQAQEFLQVQAEEAAPPPPGFHFTHLLPAPAAWAWTAEVEPNVHPIVTEAEKAHVAETAAELACLAEEARLGDEETEAEVGRSHLARLAGLPKDSRSRRALSPRALLCRSLEGLLRERSRQGAPSIFVQPGHIMSFGGKKVVKLRMQCVGLGLESSLSVCWDWDVKLESKPPQA